MTLVQAVMKCPKAYWSRKLLPIKTKDSMQTRLRERLNDKSGKNASTRRQKTKLRLNSKINDISGKECSI